MSIRHVVGFLAVGSIALSGCSALSDLTDVDSTPAQLTAEQADWVAGLVSSVGSYGVNTSNASESPSATAGPQQVLIHQSTDYRYTCTTSGDIHVLGNVSGSLSDTGTGVVLIGVTETLNSCRSKTTDGGWIELNGDPYLSLTGTFSFLNGVPSTQQTMTIGGAFRWAFNTGPSGSCSISLTVLFNSAGGGGTISGTVCGFAVNKSFT